ncbi:hypothetical protein GCM10023320_68570 [Pseudonocardia adelaidensis]|uniref:Class F sortase n=1 Tax=Pseudonocardia adelaidensis TaxID=648754 RepID=A0ABP9NY69_9PSEU
MRARAVLIALVTELGLLLAVAVLRPAGVRTDPAPAAAPVAATAFHAPVSARAEAPEMPGEPVRVRVGAVDVDSPVAPDGVARGAGWRFRTTCGRSAGTASGRTQGGGGVGRTRRNVDDREQGAGAFFRLGELTAGDAVVVDLADGSADIDRARGRASAV